MEHVESGSFRVDEEARARKMRLEKRKLWKHRAFLVVDQFGDFVFIPLAVVAAIILAICYIWMWVKGVAFLSHTFPKGSRFGVAAPATAIFGIIIHIGVISFGDLIWRALNERVAAIRKGWNG